MHSKNEFLPLEITQYDIESAQEFLYNRIIESRI